MLQQKKKKKAPGSGGGDNGDADKATPAKKKQKRKAAAAKPEPPARTATPRQSALTGPGFTLLSWNVDGVRAKGRHDKLVEIASGVSPAHWSSFCRIPRCDTGRALLRLETPLPLFPHPESSEPVASFMTYAGLELVSSAQGLTCAAPVWVDFLAFLSFFFFFDSSWLSLTSRVRRCHVRPVSRRLLFCIWLLFLFLFFWFWGDRRRPRT